MKWYHIAHWALTLSLSACIVMFMVLVAAGAVRVQWRVADAKVESNRTPGGPKTRLLVVRGLRPGWEYPIFEGENIIGRADQQPVDIDLQPLEPENRVWSSRQHAAITCKNGSMAIEDLRSSNGTYVNGSIVPPGTKRPLAKGDIIQIGEVQLKVLEEPA